MNFMRIDVALAIRFLIRSFENSSRSYSSLSSPPFARDEDEDDEPPASADAREEAGRDVEEELDVEEECYPSRAEGLKPSVGRSIQPTL